MSNFTPEEIEQLKSMAAGETVETWIDGRAMVAKYQNTEYRFPLVLTVDKLNKLPDMEDDPLGFITGICDGDASQIGAMSMGKIATAYTEAFSIANGLDLGESLPPTES